MTEANKKITRSFQILDFVLVGNSLSENDLRTNQDLRMGTHDLLTLYELCCHAGEVVPKETLIEKGWPGKIVSDSSLTQSIRNIRTLLGDNGKDQRWLKTVSKVGYMLEASIVKEIGQSNSALEVNVAPPKKSSQSKHILFSDTKHHAKFKIAILSVLLVTTFNVSYNIYQHFISPENITEYPEVGYSKGVTEVYSDRLYAAAVIGEGIVNWLDEQQIRPKKVAVLLLRKNLSLAIVDNDGNINNRLILLEENVEINKLTQLTIDEIDDVLR
ncbi:transcriptional regulator [Vibrio zhanjiangensis]|uniref:Transcriptional regulator n=1 Tax=Vibrio zhanjiangensis TaxID=1046128 RepID=A0ABQ6EW75_9VIBR|nr:winged helix-turn-helix domain-containing protein [Vibrio zhanjiangensis]GLT17448.1 transcriptional regulator [Vibrio zhanjiangensis]